MKASRARDIKSLLWVPLFVATGMLASSCVSIHPVEAKNEARRAGKDVYAKLEEMRTRWDRDAIPVGLERQLFWDDAVIAGKSSNLVRRLGTPEKTSAGPVLTTEENWEYNDGKKWGISYASVLTNDTGGFQIWYHYGGEAGRVGHAVSDDGINWKKIKRPLSSDNAVLYPAHGMCVIDDRENNKGSARYKMVYGYSPLKGSRADYGLTFAHSGNGRKWSTYGELNPLDNVRSDTGNSMMWDEELGLYRLATRLVDFDKGRGYIQLVRERINSPWHEMILALVFLPLLPEQQWREVDRYRLPDLARQIYILQMQKYHQIYVAYVNMYERSENRAYLAFSRNGIDWDWQWVREGWRFLEAGGAGTFDEFGQMNISSPFLTVGDKHYLYYIGANSPHGAYIPPSGSPDPPYLALGLATIRLDGLACLELLEGQGELETKPFVCEGKSLEVNWEPKAPHASLIVEVLDAGGAVVPGFDAARFQAIEQDSCHAACVWSGATWAALRGKNIRLRFKLEGAGRLYSFCAMP